jgi:hypothetical protein
LGVGFGLCVVCDRSKCQVADEIVTCEQSCVHTLRIPGEEFVG